jgi:hypothetical protein
VLAAAAVTLVLGAAAGGWSSLGGRDPAGRHAAAIDAGSAPIPARPAPATPPEPVAADGPCGRAMDEIRTIQREFPSGALLTAAANADLTRNLAQLDRACTATPDLADEFRHRELTPWLTYLPPGAG